MRVQRDIRIDASREEIWELISRPDTYDGFWHGLTRLDRKNEEEGLGARYALRMRVGSADLGGLIEIVECDEPGDMAWTSITGIDHRARWRLREADDGRTQVTLRLSWDAPGLLGTVADRLGAPMVARTLERTLQNLALELEDEEVREDVSGDETTRSLPGNIAYQLGSVRVLAEAGIIRPIRPDRLWGVLRTLQKWGRSPAAGAISLAARFPDETMIVDELGTLSFREVDERTNALAHALSDAGLVEGDGVGIMARNHRGFIEATIALSKLGADALYLNTAFAGPQLTEVVDREKPKAIIYDEEFAELLEDAGKRRRRFVAWHDSPSCDDTTLDELLEAGEPSAVVPPEREGRAVILTSGTTGTPKGASRGNPQSLDPVVSYLSKIPLKSRMVIHVAAPLFHSWGFAHFSLGLFLGTTSVLRRKFDPEACLAEVARSRADALAVVPVMMQRILDLPEETRSKYDLSTLKVTAASGSALTGDLANRWMDAFGDNLYNLYGSTEVAFASIATPADMRAAPGTAGRAPRGTVLKLYDEHGVEVKAGETGRIFVGNEMLFEGYTGGGSKDVIGNLMATGDVGRFDDGGRLFVEGRDDEMIVSGGENVFPKEVEDLLSRHDAVNDVAAVGVDDEDFGQRLKAFVVLESGKKATEEELKGYVKKNLARFKVPREIEFIDELPRNATGKVLKRELVEEEEEEKAAK
ncbi:MAG TPA: AMP-binding protein [Thermoleophilaceae bacterium]|nr:AMP-binding protein [Thermoleophilaceae bacterium]